MTDEQPTVEAIRFDNALAELDACRNPGLDPVEDPSLASLVDVATQVEAAEREAVDTHAFRSYSARSRAYVLDAIVLPRALLPATIPSLPWYRRFGWLRPTAAATAAAVLSVVLLVGLVQWSDGGSGSGEQPITVAQVTDETRAALDRELAEIRQSLEMIFARAERGEPVTEELLRTLAGNTLVAAQRIADEPATVTKDDVVNYIQSAHIARTVLEQATGTTETEGALGEAQAAADYGVAVASNYLVSSLRAQQQARAGP